MRRDENGYIVVETICSFLLLVFLITSILSLINIVTVQSRVHYALSQTAQSVSMYCYALEAAGIADDLTAISAKAEASQGELDKFKTNFNGLMDGIQALSPETVGNYGEALLDQGSAVWDETTSNPKGTVQNLMTYFLDQGSSAALEAVLRPLMNHYLSNGSMSGDEYLKVFGVGNGKTEGIENLEFHSFDVFSVSSVGNNDSKLLTGSGDVKLVVSYDIDYSFGALMLPFDEPYLHVTQEVITKAWLGGKGEGYKE